jgi:aquaporin Z
MMKKYFAEFLGTFILIFCGTGSIIVNQEFNGVLGLTGIAIVFGLMVMVLIYTFGSISGAHFNPAVSIAFTVAKKFSIKELPPYIISQLGGALAASFLLKFFYPNNEFLGATMPSGNELQAFLMEVVITFILMLVIMQVAHGSKEEGLVVGLAVGATIAIEAMFAGPYCGASMNPARSFGPAVASGHLEHLWIYCTATVLGAILAIFVWRYFAKHT